MNKKRQLSRKAVQKILNNYSAGTFTEEQADQHRLKLVKGGFSARNFKAFFYLLIDPSDHIIADAKFQVFGPPLLIALGESICDLLVGKSHLQAMRLSGHQVIDRIKDYQTQWHLDQSENELVELIINASKQALSNYGFSFEKNTPLPTGEKGEEGIKNWDALNREEKLTLIEDLLTEEIRPYIEMDEGGVDIVDLKDNELIIAYKGACTSCFSSVGATLSSIQEILQAKLSPLLTVTPQF